MPSTDLVEYYARRAPEYETIYGKPERQNDLSLLKAFVGRFFAHRHVLEIACGTGFWTEVLAQSAESVLATDINDEVLAIARAKPAIAASHRVDFVRANAYEFSPPRKFDACLAAFWWSHIPRNQLPGFLEKLASNLAPGATVIFIDNRYVAGSSTPIHRTDHDGNTYQLRKLADGTEREVLKNFPLPTALVNAVEPFAVDPELEQLEYYWLLRYRTRTNVAAISPTRLTA
jgi:demethylmenaquinone methyltransferase/2-methoxy-6-polyprenyl-1,4-benzoquinol methylase